MLKFFNGYKTYIGALIVGISAACRFLGQVEVADAMQGIGEAVVVAGMGHKLAKAGR